MFEVKSIAVIASCCLFGKYSGRAENTTRHSAAVTHYIIPSVYNISMDVCVGAGVTEENSELRRGLQRLWGELVNDILINCPMLRFFLLRGYWHVQSNFLTQEIPLPECPRDLHFTVRLSLKYFHSVSTVRLSSTWANYLYSSQVHKQQTPTIWRHPLKIWFLARFLPRAVRLRESYQIWLFHQGSSPGFL